MKITSLAVVFNTSIPILKYRTTCSLSMLYFSISHTLKSGTHQADIRQISGKYQAIIRQMSGKYLVSFWSATGEPPQKIYSKNL
jgi:hypothetical protein